MTPLDLLLWSLAILALVTTATVCTIIVWATITAIRKPRATTLFRSDADR